MPTSPQPGCARRFDAAVATLARPADLRSLPLPAVHLMLGLRLCAMCEAAGSDAVAELTQRYRNVAAALAVVELSREIARVWPEPFVVGRPCRTAMSPDEATVADLVRAAAHADRHRFGRAIAGFVRAERHECLFAATVVAVAALQPKAG